MAYVIGVSLTFPRTEDKTLFVLVGGIVFLLAAIELTRGLRGRPKIASPAEEGDSDARSAVTRRRRLGSALGWMTGFMVGTYFLGFNLASTLFILSYSRLHGAGWFKATAIAVVTTAILYFTFMYGLKVELHRGVIF